MKHSTHKYGKPYHRKVHIDGEEWSWRCSGNHVWIRSPDGKMTIHADNFEVSRIHPDDWIRIPDANYENMPSIDIQPFPSVIPSDIIEFIKTATIAQ